MPGDSFPIDAAQMVGLFMESVFYGVSLVSFFNCLRVLLLSEGRFKPLHQINKTVIFAASLMFIFATLDVTFHLRHNLEAFVYFNGDPEAEFDKVSNWINVMPLVLYVLQTFVGDSILIFRCWIIYEQNCLVVALPILFWLGTAACGAVSIYTEATLDTSQQLLNSSRLKPFITGMLCLTLVTNILTTSLIVNRIWTVRQSLKQGFTLITGSPLTNLIITFIQSGLLYTFSVIILFSLYMASNNGQYGVSNAIVQIIGITFNLMITSADRRHPTSHSGRSHLRNQSSQGNIALHIPGINVQKTVSYFTDPPTLVEFESDVENLSSNQEWEAH
ncbi:hypothetical protein CPB84DRAFT_1778517 [Gymnopilus junonius]|uniref:Uncharacterized protein n=1 Tax=Gymnopilus junonius TaxID=109634 RepID=A0A9P5NQS6_GYMJU|nr:hypothetical protein CPB84DRAFT_1778517 [Gymnopilus junonius]